VNTNGLAKHYDILTPWERLPLILAAAARGDEQERLRLLKSAPRLPYEVQDHAGLAHAFSTLSTVHLLSVLDLVAAYFLLLGMTVAEEGETEKEFRDATFMHGHLLQVRLAGWRLFCAQHQFHPEVFWRRMPGFDTVKLAEGIVGAASFTRDEACQYAKQRGLDPAKVPTAEVVAAGLREAFQAGVEWWT
jgi:hypothetical protein